MDVHVNVVGVHIEVDKVRHLLAFGHKTVVRHHHCLMEIRMLHVATVDEEVLMSALLTRRLGLTHEAGDATHRCVDVQRKKVLIDFLAEDVNDALSQTAGTEIIHLVVVIVERESYLGIYKGYALESAYNVVKFGGVRLQELPSCRNIEEEILNLEVASNGT